MGLGPHHANGWPPPKSQKQSHAESKAKPKAKAKANSSTKSKAKLRQKQSKAEAKANLIKFIVCMKNAGIVTPMIHLLIFFVLIGLHPFLIFYIGSVLNFDTLNLREKNAKLCERLGPREIY